MNLKNGRKSNKKIGNEFEQEFSDILYDNGFWSSIFPQNQRGQPFDVIAGKDNHLFAFDCKVCNNDRFLIKRIEPNQEESMSLLNEVGCQETFFAIKFVKHDEIYLVRFQNLMMWAKNSKSIPYSFIKTWGSHIDAWLELWK